MSTNTTAVTGITRRMPKGLGYLTDKWATSPRARLRFRRRGENMPVNPELRIKDWNIRPGDQVRLTTGRPEHKYVNEKDESSGYRIWTVNSVDVRSNSLKLEGLKDLNRGEFDLKPLPEGARHWSDNQKKAYQRSSKPQKGTQIHYSHVQLLVEENGTDSVFATRISTEPSGRFDPVIGRSGHERYAAALSGPTNRDPDPSKGKINIPWPTFKPDPAPAPSTADTLVPGTRTFAAPSADYLASSARAAAVIPASLHAPAPADHSIPGRYIAQPEARSDAALDVLMPLFLSEELGPRFSRAKRTQAYNDRQTVLERERTSAIRAAVNKWEAGGRDRDLSVALAAANLDGLSIRGRTRGEVREMAAAQFDEVLEQAKRAPREAARMEMSWDAEQGAWVPGDKVRKVEKKREGKLAKQAWKASKMEALTLKPGKNMVVPPEAMA